MPDPTEFPSIAQRLADEVLLPDAAAVDAADRVPEAHLRALDDAGLTGLAAAGVSPAQRLAVAAALAGGSLSTAFVWMQHQGALAAVARADTAVAREAAPRLASGALRAGVAITALRPPTPLRITRAADGWTLTGRVPWVTGWNVLDALWVAALDGDDLVRTALVDVRGVDGIRAERLDLVAARASGTCTIEFDAVPVADERLISSVPLAEWQVADAAGLGGNGALALGVAERAARLAGSVRLQDEVRSATAALLAADVAGLPAARAACSALAVRATGALTVRSGARSVLVGSDAERLAREAQFLLVFGARPAIRDALLADLDA